MLEPLLKGDFGREADCLLEPIDARARFNHVAGLRWSEFDHGFSSQELLQHPDKQDNFHRTVVADVENSKRRNRRLHRRVEENLHNTVNNVVDVREVPPVLTLVEQLDGLPFTNRFREQDRRHVGPAPRSVHREERRPVIMKP